jgi:hypothetical protein
MCAHGRRAAMCKGAIQPQPKPAFSRVHSLRLRHLISSICAWLTLRNVMCNHHQIFPQCIGREALLLRSALSPVRPHETRCTSPASPRQIPRRAPWGTRPSNLRLCKREGTFREVLQDRIRQRTEGPPQTKRAASPCYQPKSEPPY